MLTIERLIEDELFIVCPLISSGDFVKFCKERDITVDEKDLELYEKLGILYRHIQRASATLELKTS